VLDHVQRVVQHKQGQKRLRRSLKTRPIYSYQAQNVVTCQDSQKEEDSIINRQRQIEVKKKHSKRYKSEQAYLKNKSFLQTTITKTTRKRRPSYLPHHQKQR
jgi:hypothetical protein